MEQLAAEKLETTITTGVLWPTPTLTLTIGQPEEFNRALAQIVLTEEQKIRQKTKATPVAGIDAGLTAHWLEFNVELALS